MTLEAHDISVRFGGVQALAGVSLAVPDNAVVGLLGPNGAGKSTLFAVLSGLLRPNSGRVLLDGSDVTRSSPQARARRGLARTFQRLELFGELSVRDHLVLAHRVRAQGARLGMDLLGVGRRPGPTERTEVDELLRLLDLSAVADAPARALPLSKGRLVEVARALATRPGVLLLDEPSSGLDAAETEQLVGVLRRLRDEERASLVVVEHDVELVLSLADRVTVLDFGRVIAEGSPADVRADVAVAGAYLGTVG